MTRPRRVRTPFGSRRVGYRSEAMEEGREGEREVSGVIDLVVSGEVQGVGFRHFVASSARSLGLRGFVRNLPDGRVAIRAEGSGVALDRLHEAVRGGPVGSRVTDVARSEVAASELFARFEIRF